MFDPSLHSLHPSLKVGGWVILFGPLARLIGPSMM
jgi:hypothetical protein